MIAIAALVSMVARASESVEFKLEVTLDGSAAGLEFFVELPADCEFVEFNADVGGRVVHKTTADGVWLGLFTNMNAYDAGTLIVGVIRVRGLESSLAELNVAHRYAYRLLDSGDQIDTELFSMSTALSKIEPPPPDTSPAPSATPSPTGSGGSSGGGYSTDNGDSDESEPTGDSTPSKVTFSDLGDAEWARKEIEYFATFYGIMGVGDGKFAPNAQLTRAQFARFMAVALSLPDIAGSHSAAFSDVTPDDWFYADVTTLAKLGIVVGYPNGEFRPAEPVTREQMAVMLLRALAAKGYWLEPVRPFMLTEDIDAASEYAVGAIRTLYRAGLIEGTADLRYEPQSGATRAEACVLLYRVLRAIGMPPR
jgi:hypothetical protein